MMEEERRRKGLRSDTFILGRACRFYPLILIKGHRGDSFILGSALNTLIQGIYIVNVLNAFYNHLILKM